MMKKTIPIAAAALWLGSIASSYAAPDVAVGGKVNISNNKVGTITAGGGKADVSGIAKKIIGGSIDLTTAVNANSVVVQGGAIRGSVNVSGNEAGEITAIGGMVNANSLYVNTRK